ncbi:hypothetical protein LINPERPRIM_LOCUS7095 [Linum perenne]
MWLLGTQWNSLCACHSYANLPKDVYYWVQTLQENYLLTSKL